MKKSLHKVLFLTVATTALSTIPSYSSDDGLRDPAKPALRTIHRGDSGAPVAVETRETPATPRAVDPTRGIAPVASTGCGCGAWFSRLFSRRNLQQAGEFFDELGGLAQVGLTVAGAATGNKQLTDIASGIGSGVRVVHTITTDLSGPGGVSATSALRALNDGADGAVTIAGQVAPGSRSQVSNVVRIIKASDDAASTLLGPDGKPTLVSALTAGGKVAGIVADAAGDRAALTAEEILSAEAAALAAKRSVTVAVDAVNPLPASV